ncbi:8-amino-7-oxononanoate synthase [Corallincola platygyrae]|uniref:8-amino-7-oxononanoate synthase n=1 Tax=Corallincola platygyrae TaxID=1193278 RepID=A0ABW4XML6_9GAMM
MAFDHLRTELAQKASQSLLRKRTAFVAGAGRYLVSDEKRFLNFASNDYLGLAEHPKVIAAWKHGADKFGVGSGGSYLITGYAKAHQSLEEKLAHYTGQQKAILFSSGFAANSAVLHALLSKHDLLVQDKLNHASLIDSGLDSAAKMVRFKHNDVDSLNQQLSRDASNKLVVTEGVFSMDGDQAPINDIAGTCNKHDAWLMVDDAHAFGVTGKGKGSLASVLPMAIRIYMATFGKALGVSGAFVAGSDELVEYLLQYGRHYIYTTAMPPAQACAIEAALSLAFDEEAWRRDELNRLISQFRFKAQAENIPLMDSKTAIQPVLLGSVKRTLEIGERLKRRGFWVGTIRPPTVPEGAARLRITLSASHKPEDIDKLVAALAEELNDVGV